MDFHFSVLYITYESTEKMYESKIIYFLPLEVKLMRSQRRSVSLLSYRERQRWTRQDLSCDNIPLPSLLVEATFPV